MAGKIGTWALFFLLIWACNSTLEEQTDVDAILSEKLNQASGGLGIDYYQMPESEQLNKIPQDPENPLTEAKVALGKLLFHETALAVNPSLSKGLTTYSCASCHHAEAGFQSGLRQGIGEGGIGFGQSGEGRIKDPEYTGKAMDVQPIKSPSVLNVAYQKNMLFNGQFGATGENEGTEYAWLTNTPREINYLGFEGVESQAIAGMDTHHMDVDDQLIENLPAYKPYFDQAFPQVPEEDRCNLQNAGLAIAAYERTLLANQAPFQQWLKGNKEALSKQAKEGAILFFSKAKCFTCHNGPALSSMAFYGLGMKDLYQTDAEIFNASRFSLENKGRGGFTEKQADMFKFKVPQLYNLKSAGFYGHGASFNSLKAIVQYKNEAIAENEHVPPGQLAEDFKPLQLNDDEIEKIVAFLEDGLFDPNLNRYVPQILPSDNCFPNNDFQSRIDLGCE